MNKLEEVARAVLGELIGRRGVVGRELEQIRDHDPEIWDEIIQAVGRTALAALREPSWVMLDAGQGEIVIDTDEQGIVTWASREEMEAAWQAMIDAAKEDKA